MFRLTHAFPPCIRSRRLTTHALVVAVMKRTCPRSCGICEHACSDANSTCVAWALGGECESNADFMLRHCPTSCGICTPECKDHVPEVSAHVVLARRAAASALTLTLTLTLTKCAGWAHLGECAKNPDFAHRKCPVSCGVCKSACKDTNSSCGAWAADGQCDGNPSFMYKTCPLACDVCAGHPGDCDDVSNSTVALGSGQWAVGSGQWAMWRWALLLTALRYCLLY